MNVVEDDNINSGLGKALIAVANQTVLRVKDGQQLRLDTKYGQLFNKKRNVQVVTITNSPVRCIRERGPFLERFMRLR